MSQNLSHAVMAQRHEPVTSLDLFPTPPWATRAMCEFIRSNIGPTLEMSCWEPACGYLNMVRPLKEYFEVVTFSDVHPHFHGCDLFDFLMPVSGTLFCQPDWIITNPPFRLAAAFALRAIEVTDCGVGMLVRTAFLEGQDRYETLFKPHPPAFVFQFTERVPMHKGKLTATGSTATAYCWVIWLPPFKGHPQFRWIAPCRKRLERATDYQSGS